MEFKSDRQSEHLLPRDLAINDPPAAPLFGIVDDDQAIRESLDSLVRSAGFRAKTFSSAEEYLVSGLIYDTNCLILDLHLPKMSGLDLQCRLSVTNHPLRIIFATAHVDDRARTQAFERGAFAFLTKPFECEALLDAMQSAVR